MKNTKLIALLFAAVAVIGLAAPSAFAAAGTESFGLTNIISTGTTMTAAPTNVAGVLTGGALNLDNVTQIGITVSGANTIGGVTNTSAVLTEAPTTNYLYLELVRSTVGYPPIGRDFETFPKWSWKVPINGTTRVVYTTNLAESYISDARWIGISACSNTCLSGVFTNAIGGNIVTITKKIRAVQFP